MNVRRVALVVLSVLLGVLAIKFVLPFFTPFIVGLFFAGLIEPAIGWFEKKWHWSRPAAVFTTLTISLMVVFLLMAVILGSVYREVVRLVRDFPYLIAAGERLIDHVDGLMIHFRRILPPETIRNMAGGMQNLFHYISGAAVGLIGLFQSIPEIIGTTILAVLTTYFVARDKSLWSTLMVRYLPEAWRSGFNRAVRKLLQAIMNLFRLEITMMVIAFILIGTSLSLLGNGRAWLIGLLVGLLEPLPMVGPGAVLLPWSGWLFVTGQWPTALVLLLICGALIFSRQWLELRWLGKGFGVHPLFTLIGLYLGFKFMGLIGLLLAPLVLSMAGSIYATLGENKEPEGRKFVL